MRQSRAHARALREAGVLDEAELGELIAGLDRVEAELEAGSFPFEQADEDIHMAVERRLTEIVGRVGGKIHTGRSRNDQVATDLAMFVADRSDVASGLLEDVLVRIAALASEHRDWRMPGYTHLQRAQPVSLGHHLMAWFWMLARDLDRFAAARHSAGVMPLGSGALAGVNWSLDRRAVAAELGFHTIAPNSMDGVANRDFAIDYLAAAATCATHLSRIGSEIVLWASSEFGFCKPAEEFSSGSSIMPQKMNPDAAELLRAKAPRIVASLTTLLGVQHALPLAYSKDLQEDKEPLFDAVDTIELSLQALAGMLDGIAFDRGRMEAAASDEMAAATDVADLLVRRGLPFREAHGVVGSLVRYALDHDIGLSADSARAARGLLGAARRRVLRGARERELARFEALRRRHLGGVARGPAGRRPRADPPPLGVTPAPLPQSFFERDVVEVARELIGCTLELGGRGGRIVETEAYDESEPACHAYVGVTARTRPLFGPAGHAYVYLSYGIHELFNVVTGAEGHGAAVLIRALEPVRDLDGIRARRPGRADRELCSGPGRLTLALGIGLGHNGAPLGSGRDDLPGIGPRPPGAQPRIESGPRIGITKATALPWRFCEAASPWISGPRPPGAEAAGA